MLDGLALQSQTQTCRVRGQTTGVRPNEESLDDVFMFRITSQRGTVKVAQ